MSSPLVKLYTDDVPGKQARTKDEMIDFSTSTLRGLKAAFANVFNKVWRNPYSLTPQQVLDGYGVQAGQLFSDATSLAAYIISLDPNYVPPSPADLVPPKTYVINNDGTVTVA